MNTPPLQKIFDASVLQDKSDSLRDRFASQQPYRPPDEIRSNQKGGRSNHTSNGNATGRTATGSTPEPLVPFTTQIRRPVKAEIQRLAKQEGLSDSATGAAFLEKAIQGHIDLQYGALLKPVIETTIERKIQSYSDRTANLALKAFYSAEQARILCTHILGLLLHDIEALPGYIADAQKEAWENMKRYGKDGDETGAESPWQLSK